MGSSREQIVFQGIVAGFVGYLVTMVIMAAASTLAGQSPFHFAALMGATLFYGAADAAVVAISPQYILPYNGVHLLVFLGMGMLFSWLASVAERGAQLWYLSLFVFMFVCFHLVVAVQMLAGPARAAVPGFSIYLAGLVAAGAMGAYLLRAHPKLRQGQSWTD